MAPSATHTASHTPTTPRGVWQAPAHCAARGGGPTWATHSYRYQASTGALCSVALGGDTVATFTYDDDGRLAEQYHGGLRTQAGDADGRMKWQRDTFAYDARGERTRVWAIADTTTNVYDGMGALAWSFNKKLGQFDTSEEAYSPDPLANNYASLGTFSSDKQELNRYEQGRNANEARTGRVISEGRWENSTSGMGGNTADNFTSTRYDAAGNRCGTGSSGI